MKKKSVQPFFYKITNLINNRFYYGSGSRENYMGSSSILKSAIKKYGKKNFKIEKLRFFDTRQEAFEFEDRFLKIYKISSLKESYNQKDNGVGGNTHVNWSEERREEFRIKMSEVTYWKDKNKKISPETCLKIKLALTGKKLTEEHKKNISKGNLGKHFYTEEIKAKIAKGASKAVDINNIVYESHKAAAQALGVTPLTIKNRIFSNNDKFKNYKIKI